MEQDPTRVPRILVVDDNAQNRELVRATLDSEGYCTVLVASEGQVSSTPHDAVPGSRMAAAASVWWLQNPGKPFAALTTSVVA